LQPNHCAALSLRSMTLSSLGQGRNETRGIHLKAVLVQRADAARLLALVRRHWRIENQSHWARDVTVDEDRSQVWCGNIPQVMAALRNTVIGLRRGAGYTHIAATCRRFAAQPALALALIGIALEN
jgi:hypothetical protein